MSEAKKDIAKLAQAHVDARARRKQLESELESIPNELNTAINAGDTKKIQELTRRKRDIQLFEFSEASSVENACAKAEFRAQQQAAHFVCLKTAEALEQAEQNLKAEDARFEDLRQEHELKRAELQLALANAKGEHNSATGVQSSWVEREFAVTKRYDEEVSKYNNAA